MRTFGDVAAWIDQALAGLGIEQAHVVGHSFGGASAAALAVHHPVRVRTLTLLEPVMTFGRLPVSMMLWATVLSLPTPRAWRDRALAGGVRAADRARTLLSHGAVRVWPNTTHSLPMQAHAELDAALLAFWATTDRSQRVATRGPELPPR